MEKSLFFNAMPDATKPTGYDRNYNADDISDWLSAFFDTGVMKTDSVNNEPQGLKVVASTGLTVNVKSGRAAVKGKGYINTSNKSLTFDIASGTARYDMVVLRYNNNASTRKISIEVKKGTSSIPTVSSLTRVEGTVWELLLAYVRLDPSASTIGQIVDTRGNTTLCPWFTASKGYEDYYDAMIMAYESNVTLSSTGSVVTTDISKSLYNERYSIIEVYTNGIKEQSNAYTVSTNNNFIVITFNNSKAANSKITVVLNNFLDGEGMSSAIADYTRFTQDIVNLKAANEINYVCNGVNDNILISNIVKTFYSVNDYKSLKLNVIGNIGMSTAARGDGSTSNPYAWFDFTKQVETGRVATIDFSNCSPINPTIADAKYTIIFRGEVFNIIGANIIASNIVAETMIRVSPSSSGTLNFDNCRFWITGYKDSLIASTGNFTNCRGSVSNVINNSYCFNVANAAILRLFGGEYYAYTGDSGRTSAIIGQSGENAVSILYGVNSPTSARDYYYQKLAVYQLAGWVNCTDLITALDNQFLSGKSNVRGTIPLSK